VQSTKVCHRHGPEEGSDSTEKIHPERILMKSTRYLLSALLVGGAVTLVPQGEVQAQVAIGFHGTATEIRARTTWGLGGRLAYLFRDQPGLSLALEGVGEYLWPSCDVSDCNAMLFQANLLGRRRVASYAETYGGVGFAYQDFKVDSGTNTFDGDDWGVTLILGTQGGAPGGTRPFLELRYSFMADVSNQWGASLGVRFPLGR